MPLTLIEEEHSQIFIFRIFKTKKLPRNRPSKFYLRDSKDRDQLLASRDISKQKD